MTFPKDHSLFFLQNNLRICWIGQRNDYRNTLYLVNVTVGALHTAAVFFSNFKQAQPNFGNDFENLGQGFRSL